MRIRDGWHEYEKGQELLSIMKKIANLSGHKAEIFDSILSSNKDFYRSMDDNGSAESALIYLFLEDKERLYFAFQDLMPDMFKKLSYSEQHRFIGFYDSIKDIAMKHGFLIDYEEVRSRIKPLSQKILELLFLGSAALLMYSHITNLTQYLLALLLIEFYRGSFNAKDNLAIKQQNEFLIQKANKKEIEKRFERAKRDLIYLGWIKQDDSSVDKE